MLVSLKWIRDYIDLTLPGTEVAHKLTMAGIEVGKIESTGELWDNIVIGQVIAINPHPNADRLKLVSIDTAAEPMTVVCGATNINIGDKVPFAYVDAQLIDGHTRQLTKLEPAKIRGVVSKGMVCSERELGLSDAHTGIMIFPAEASVGTPLVDYMGDTILDLEVTPNRPDCLSVIGVAREIAALSGQEMRIDSTDYEESDLPIGNQVSVEIQDSDLCRRYCASLIKGIKIAPSPPWMQKRLIACGMRPINNVVDITNYVMLEYGQPLHAFDFDCLKGGKIKVRRGREGEPMTTLDGVERSLTKDMLIIADDESPVAIAGVMGGATSEVNDGTTTLLLESANFKPVSIRRTSTSLRLGSEASSRFEKALSPELSMHALKRATQLILKVAGGKAAKGIIDVYPNKTEIKPISLSLSQVKRITGARWSMKQIRGVLSHLGFECEQTGPSQIQVTPPYWRTDITQDVDIIEEVARIIGYEHIPMTTLSSQLPPRYPESDLLFKEKVRDIITSCGFQEVITYSLTSKNKMDNQSALRLLNPMSSEQEYLRTSLRPHILTILASNQRHAEQGIKIFEINNVFCPQDSDLPKERVMLTGLLSGSRIGRAWLGEKGAFDFFDAKGILEYLMTALGIRATFEAGKDEYLHPGKTAIVKVGENAVGVVGELHPQIAETYDLLPHPIALFEIDVEKLLIATTGKITYKSLPRFPSSVRDLALIVNSQTPAEDAKSIIEGFSLVSQVALFDVYAGKQVTAGKKSLAFSVTYQSMTHTLTDSEIEEVEITILAKLSQDIGAILRD